MSSNIQYFSTSSNKLVSKHAVVKQLQRKRKAEPEVHHTVESLGYKVHVPDNMIINPTTGRIIKKSKKNLEKAFGSLSNAVVKLEETTPIGKMVNPLTGRYLKNTKQNKIKVALTNGLGYMSNIKLHPEDMWTIKQEFKPNQFNIGTNGFMNKVKHYIDKQKIKGAFKLGIKSLEYDDKVYEFVFGSSTQLKDTYAKLISVGDDYQRTGQSIQGRTLAKNQFNAFEIVGMQPLTGGCNKNGAGTMTLTGYNCEIVLDNPYTQRNQCSYKACIKQLRKYYPYGTPFITCNMLYKKLGYEKESVRSTDEVKVMYLTIIKDLQDEGIEYLTPPHPLKLLVDILDVDVYTEMTESVETHELLLLHENHYYTIISFKDLAPPPPPKERKQRHKIATYDFECRSVDSNIKVGETKCKVLKETILKIGYENYKQCKKDESKIDFVVNMFATDVEGDGCKTAGRKFVDLLNESKSKFKWFAHNGSNFDVFFVLGAMSPEEFAKVKIFRKGLSLTKVEYNGHFLLDSMNHLTGSLDSLCKDFKVEKAKITEFKLNGKVLTSTELCFYKPELSFKEFMNLKNTEPEYWAIYCNYCEYDVLSLYEIIIKYKEACNEITTLLAKKVLDDGTVVGSHNIEKNCKITDKLTIGSASLTLLKEIAKVRNRYAYKIIREFTNCTDKEKFIRSCLTGGISHCHRPGTYEEQICDVDICSQYPAAMLNCLIPCGTSKSYTGEELKALEDYSVYNYHGYYHLRNVQFTDSCPDLKLVPQKVEGESLHWRSPNFHDTLNIDSQMLVYLLYKGYIHSYDVESALLSTQCISGEKMSGIYIKALFAAKSKQDVYKELDAKEYNPALRTVYKLLMNSVYGKMLEDKGHYTSMVDKRPEDGTGNHWKEIKLNGQTKYLKPEEDCYNELITFGLSILSYSKILLFEYIGCLPNNTDDMLAAETDGFMFEKKHMVAFNNNLNKWKFEQTKESLKNPSKYQKIFENLPCKLDREEIIKNEKGEDVKIRVADIGNLTYKSVSHPEFKSYFVMKKTYYYVEDKASKESSKEMKEYMETGKVPIGYVVDSTGKLFKVVAKMKGIPNTTINDAGEKIAVIKEEHYVELFLGNDVPFKFNVLKKRYEKEFQIIAYEMTRRVRMIRN